MKKNEKKQVYVNEKQKAFLQSTAKNKDIIGGRGSGKTALMGLHNFMKMGYMPGAKSGLAALTYTQILNNSMPAMEKVWEACGLKEHFSTDEPGHFVIGKRPPLHWKKCINPPRKYDNVISFFNGYTIQLISLDRPDTIRGLSLDALDVDEKGWVKQDDYQQILKPLVRANLYESFTGHYLHHSKCGFSSMPWFAKQQWILKAEEHAIAEPDDYFYIESTALDNIHILGENYIKDAQRTTPPHIYMVEYMNERPTRVSNAFYPAFNNELHCDFKTYDYDQNDNGLWISKPSDVHKDKPLEISFDFNAAFTSAIICQEHKYKAYTEFRTCDEVYVEEAKVDMITDICQEIIQRYQDHPKKDIFIYGDRNGNNKTPNSNETFYTQIMRILGGAGFNCYLMVHGLDSNHKKRYSLISNIMSEQDPRLPRIRINQNKCKYLPISLQLAPMTGDFSKDKSSERPGNDQKMATHLTDCFDNIVWAKYKQFMDSEVERYEAGVA